MNKSVTKFCEICQIKIENDAIFHVLDNDCKSKLLPEIDVHLTQDSVICDLCITQITDTEEFKQLQVKDEGNVNKLPQEDILSNNNFNKLDANFNENTICIKEEPGVEKIKEEFNVGLIKDEVCDSQIVENDFLVTINEKKSTKLYYCHDCGCCTDTRQKLIRHIYKQHSKKDFMRKLISEKIYQCEKCNYKFTAKASLKRHTLSRHIGEKPYHCDKCDYKCGLKSYLKSHMLSKHTETKPYQCDNCEYSFIRKGHLKSHILSKHTAEKPYQCDKCDYKCSNKARLKAHICNHSREKPYRCEKCDYKCCYKRYLKIHIASKHTGEKPFHCDKCGYKSAQKGHLKRHKLIHTNEKL